MVSVDDAVAFVSFGVRRCSSLEVSERFMGLKHGPVRTGQVDHRLAGCSYDSDTATGREGMSA